MKKALLIAFVCLFSTSAIAGNIVRDRSGAYRCTNSTGGTISYYQPFGRVPSVAEQVKCKQAGGKITKPGPTKAVAMKIRMIASYNNQLKVLNRHIKRLNAQIASLSRRRNIAIQRRKAILNRMRRFRR